MAADSTMLRTVNLLIALSLGTHREQFEQRTGLTCPRPDLLRPPFLLFFVILKLEVGLEGDFDGEAEGWARGTFDRLSQGAIVWGDRKSVV